MDQQTIDLVRKSSAQVPWQSARLNSNFQIYLFNASPEAQTAYARGLRNQGHEMPAFFGAAADMLSHPEALNKQLVQLGEKHVGSGIFWSHYSALCHALLATLQTELQHQFTPEARSAWSAFYNHVSQRMMLAESAPS